MLNLALPGKKCEITKTELKFSPDIKYKDWEEIGDKLKTMHGFVHFWIGDWLNFGEARYGEMYSQAMDQSSFAYSTLANDKWVASRVEPSRRREKLSFEHHKEVADFEAEDQEILLGEAEKNNLNRSAFRKLVYQYTLRLDAPELTEKEIIENQKASDDFNLVQPVIDVGVDFLEKVMDLLPKIVDKNARDYFYSHLREVLKVISPLIIKHEKQRFVPENVEQETQV